MDMQRAASSSHHSPSLTGPQRPQPPQVQPPMVYVYEKQEWEYKTVVKKPAKEELPTEQELSALGANGWELAGVVTLADCVHFYLKRLRN